MSGTSSSTSTSKLPRPSVHVDAQFYPPRVGLTVKVVHKSITKITNHERAELSRGFLPGRLTILVGVINLGAAVVGLKGPTHAYAIYLYAFVLDPGIRACLRSYGHGFLEQK